VRFGEVLRIDTVAWVMSYEVRYRSILSGVISMTSSSKVLQCLHWNVFIARIFV